MNQDLLYRLFWQLYPIEIDTKPCEDLNYTPQHGSGDAVGDEGSSGTTATNYYDNVNWGVSFNVNDDLSVSYGEVQSRKAGYSGSNAQATGEAGRVVEVSSWQAAYTMGGASFRIADVKVDNNLWSVGANRNATVVSLGLAF